MPNIVDELHVAFSCVNRAKGCYFGAIMGDVYGAPYEFLEPEWIEAPLPDQLQSGGHFNLPVGYYTDDTSMMLCLSESIVENDGSNTHDQMQKYVDWMQKGYMSSNGKCFDVGTQTQMALNYYALNKVFVPRMIKFKNSAGNGALMRIAPVPIYFKGNELDKVAEECTLITHNNNECVKYSIFWSRLVHDVIYNKMSKSDIQSVFELMFSNINPKNVRGSGYVLDSVYIALKCFLSTETYIDCIKSVVEQGYDTDTNACIAGQLAGAFYGYDNIPMEWIKDLKDFDKITQMFDALYFTRR